MRWFKNEATGNWTRYEPWMSMIVDVDTGKVLGIVGGRNSRSLGAWFKARPAT